MPGPLAHFGGACMTSDSPWAGAHCEETAYSGAASSRLRVYSYQSREARRSCERREPSNCPRQVHASYAVLPSMASLFKSHVKARNQVAGGPGTSITRFSVLAGRMKSEVTIKLLP